MEGVDYVFHLAATNINRSVVYPEESFDINFRGSQVVFKSALENGVKKSFLLHQRQYTVIQKLYL